MYYTLGYKISYEKFFAETKAAGTGPPMKDTGGWALSLARARFFKEKLIDQLWVKEHIPHLPVGEYNIYELPDCTDDIVNGENLTEATRIGDIVG